MKKYRLKGGMTLTEADFEKLGAAAEKGEYPGTPGAWVVRPQGRPTLSDEDLVSITIKVPRSQRAAIDAKAAERGETRSQFMREAVRDALAVG